MDDNIKSLEENNILQKIPIVVEIIFALILVVFDYFIVFDLKQGNKLITELNEISDLVNEENVNIDDSDKTVEDAIEDNKGSSKLRGPTEKNQFKNMS